MSGMRQGDPGPASRHRTAATDKTSASPKVVPVQRNGRWGWGVEWSFPGEFPVTRGFFTAEAAARAVAERCVQPDC